MSSVLRDLAFLPIARIIRSDLFIHPEKHRPQKKRSASNALPTLRFLFNSIDSVLPSVVPCHVL